MRSEYHNLPIVGGVGQKDGRSFAAAGTTYACTDDKVAFGTDIAGAYPAEAGVNSWQRGYVFDRTAGTVSVTDDFALNEAKEVQLVLMTTVKPVFAPGKMILTIDENTAVTADFDPQLTPATELFPTAWDASLTRSWGEEGLYRTVFTLPGKVKSGSHTFTFVKK
jgi:hypothetical protein